MARRGVAPRPPAAGGRRRSAGLGGWAGLGQPAAGMDGGRRCGWRRANPSGGGGRAPEQSSRGLEEAQEGDVARGV